MNKDEYWTDDKDRLVQIKCQTNREVRYSSGVLEYTLIHSTFLTQHKPLVGSTRFYDGIAIRVLAVENDRVRFERNRVEQVMPLKPFVKQTSNKGDITTYRVVSVCDYLKECGHVAIVEHWMDGKLEYAELVSSLEEVIKICEN